MAGRGRARGRAQLSFNVESLGFGRGESMPGSILQPPPLFPPLEFKPLPLPAGEEQDYLLVLKQELRNAMKEAPYHIKPLNRRRDIERYSDKYTLGNQSNGNKWQPDWDLLPAELKPAVQQKRHIAKSGKPGVRPCHPAAPKPDANPDLINKTLEELEKKEGDEEEKPSGQDKEGDDEEAEDEEEFYEEDMEEETDYNLNYFDNGEGFGMDEEDDLDEGPVY